MKQCSKCGEAKEDTEFRERRRQCKGCSRPDPARVRERALARQYGIDQATYLELLAHSGGRCPICLREPREGEHFDVDHDHVCGWLRGVACRDCNRRVIGRWRRGHMEPLKRTVAYLENPPGLQLYPGRRVSERRPNGRKWADA